MARGRFCGNLFVDLVVRRIAWRLESGHLGLLAIAVCLFDIDHRAEPAAGGMRDWAISFQEQGFFVGAAAHKRIDHHVTLANAGLAPAFHRPSRFQLVIRVNAGEDIRRFKLGQANIESKGDKRVEFILRHRNKQKFVQRLFDGRQIKFGQDRLRFSLCDLQPFAGSLGMTVANDPAAI